MMIMQHLYHLLRTILPRPVRRVLKTLALRAVVRSYDRLKDPNNPWPLHGPLSGYVFKVRNAVERQYVLSETCYESSVCVTIQRVVRPGMICADVGANIGYMTLLLAHCCGPSGKVYAFEALPSNVEQLKENVAVNRLMDRVIIENLAVSDRSLSRVFLYEGDSTFEFSLLPRVNHTGSIEVPAVALDDYFTERSHLDFVKMDIEGAEGQAIAGMRRILRNQRPICLIEVHGKPGLSALDQLVDAGYALFGLDEHPVDVTTLESASISHILTKPSKGVI